MNQVIAANLASAFYCVTAVLPAMRTQRDGVLIHTASLAGRFVSRVSGPAYTAVKHGVVAMSHSINMEECANGIRSTALCPGEVATEFLDQRPVPVSADDRARLLQPEDVADLIGLRRRLGAPHLHQRGADFAKLEPRLRGGAVATRMTAGVDAWQRPCPRARRGGLTGAAPRWISQ